MFSISVCDGLMRYGDSLERILNCYFKARDVLVEIRKYNSLSEMMRLGDRADIVFLDSETISCIELRSIQTLFKCNPKLYLYILSDKHFSMSESVNLYVFKCLEKPVDARALYHSLDIILEMEGTVSFTSDYLNIMLKEDEIVCIYSFKRKTYVITDKGTIYPTIVSIKQWGRKISNFKNFCHPHYSYIINSKYINSFDGRTIVLKCLNGKAISVTPSQRNLVEFRNDYYEKIGVRGWL